MLKEEQVLNIFRRVGVILTDGHFVYTSGKHGSVYFNKDAVYAYPREVSKLCKSIAEKFLHPNVVDIVIGPAVGGVILSQWVAYHLSRMSGEEVLSVYAEKDERQNKFIIKRGYDKLIEGKNVLVVEDVLTTGGSAKGVVEAVRDVGGRIMGLTALYNRGCVTTNDLNVPMMFVLVDIKLGAQDEKDCRLCARGVPINTDVGHGKDFLRRKKSKKEGW